MSFNNKKQLLKEDTFGYNFDDERILSEKIIQKSKFEKKNTGASGRNTATLGDLENIKRSGTNFTFDK